jgi:hypothetical protein
MKPIVVSKEDSNKDGKGGKMQPTKGKNKRTEEEPREPDRERGAGNVNTKAARQKQGKTNNPKQGDTENKLASKQTEVKATRRSMTEDTTRTIAKEKNKDKTIQRARQRRKPKRYSPGTSKQQESTEEMEIPGEKATQQTSMHSFFPTRIKKQKRKCPNNAKANKPKKHSQERIQREETAQDDEAWGDNLKQKQEGAFRVCFQNVHGIPTKEGYITAREIATNAADRKADFIGMAETNLDWSIKETEHQVKTQLHRELKNMVMITSQSIARFDSAFQPGGTMAVAIGRWSGRVTNKFEDIRNLGRWTVMTITGKDNTNFTIITAYCPTQSIGPRTVHKQQMSIMRVQGDPDPKPIPAFWRDLSEVVTRYQDENHSVLIQMDANTCFEARDQALAKFAEKHGLYDLHKHLHPDLKPPRTYQFGSRQVDFTLGDSKVMDNLMAIGWEPFSIGLKTGSDHRSSTLDINIAGILKGCVIEIPPHIHRKMTAENPKTNMIYQEKLDEHLSSNNVYRKLSQLESEYESIELNEFELRADSIDRMITQGMLAAETACARNHQRPYSPVLCKARHRVHYWSIRLRALRNHNHANTALTSIARKAGIEHDQKPLSMSNVSTSLRKAQKDLKKLVKQAPALREIHMEELASAYAILEQKEKASIIKRIMRAEQQRQTYSLLKRIRKRTVGGGIESLLIDNEAENGVEPTKQRIFDQNEITSKLMEHFQNHFQQAKGSPFTVPPLSDTIGWNGTNDFCQSLLKGDIDTSGINVDEATEAILKAIRKDEDTEEIKTEIAVEDVRKGFKKWAEKTSTSPSGRHLGLYKAIIQPYNKKTRARLLNEKVKETDDLDTALIGVVSRLLEMTVNKGAILQRWRTVVRVIIEKIKGWPYIKKLRVIHLYEADLNLVLGILWNQRLIRQCEEKKILGEETWGGDQEGAQLMWS